MKKILFLLLIVLSCTINAQEYQRNGNNFVATSTVSTSNDTKTQYTFTIKDKVYPIYVTKNGRCYILRVSSKTGKEYKYYLSEEISRKICEELGIEYKELK